MKNLLLRSALMLTCLALAVGGLLVVGSAHAARKVATGAFPDFVTNHLVTLTVYMDTYPDPTFPTRCAESELGHAIKVEGIINGPPPAIKLGCWHIQSPDAVFTWEDGTVNVYPMHAFQPVNP